MSTSKRLYCLSVLSMLWMSSSAQSCWIRDDTVLSNPATSPENWRTLDVFEDGVLRIPQYYWNGDFSCLTSSSVPRDAVTLMIRQKQTLVEIYSIPEDLLWGLTALKQVEIAFTNVSIPERFFENITTLEIFRCFRMRQIE